MAILEVENLEKHFGTCEVLRDISFTMEKGSVLTILGSSGSGKTTLLRCLNFLEKPDSGKISVNGKLLFDASSNKAASDTLIRENRLHFGMVFQGFNLFPQYTALQNVTLAPLLHTKESAGNRTARKAMQTQIEADGRALLESVGLGEKCENYPHELSGGQQQRVAIARALAGRPSLLLADEPTGNLDSRTGADVMRLFHELHEAGNTIVLITHDAKIAAQTPRAIHIHDGRVLEPADENEVVI